MWSPEASPGTPSFLYVPIFPLYLDSGTTLASTVPSTQKHHISHETNRLLTYLEPYCIETLVISPCTYPAHIIRIFRRTNTNQSINSGSTVNQLTMQLNCYIWPLGVTSQASIVVVHGWLMCTPVTVV